MALLSQSASALTLTPVALHHAPLVNELYHAAPGYFDLLGTRIPNFTDIQNDIGIALMDRRRYLVLLHDQAGQMVGLLDYKTGFPQAGDVTINLLLIREDRQNQRLGEQAVRQLEALVPPETCRILASVLGDNPRGVRFWERLGYRFELDARPVMTWYAKRLLGEAQPKPSLPQQRRYALP